MHCCSTLCGPHGRSRLACLPVYAPAAAGAQVRPRGGQQRRRQRHPQAEGVTGQVRDDRWGGLRRKSHRSSRTSSEEPCRLWSHPVLRVTPQLGGTSQRGHKLGQRSIPYSVLASTATVGCCALGTLSSWLLPVALLLLVFLSVPDQCTPKCPEPDLDPGPLAPSSGHYQDGCPGHERRLAAMGMEMGWHETVCEGRGARPGHMTNLHALAKGAACFAWAQGCEGARVPRGATVCRPRPFCLVWRTAVPGWPV